MKASRSLSLAAAVALALGASHAMALDKATTLTAITNGQSLVVAGASAQRDAFLQLLQAEACVTGTLNVYRANPTTAQDFRAYSCRTVTNGGTGSIGAALGLAADKDVVVFYRSEGGSAWGPYSIAQRNIEGVAFTGIKQLDINICNAAAANQNYSLNGVNVALPTNECVIGLNSYALADDSVTDRGSGIGLIDRLTQLGTADVEPKLFTVSNSPALTSTKLHDTTQITNNLKGLAAQTGYGQVFNLIVNNGADASNVADEVTNLTTGEVAGIFSGSIRDWCKLRPTIGNCASPGVTHPIVVVRREPGSGTQVGAGVQFLSAGCGDSWNFLTDGDAPGASDTDSVIEKSTTTDLENTVIATPNANGLNLYKSTPPGGVTATKILTIDGVAPSNANAANLSYSYAFESTYTKAPVAILPAGSVPNALADGLITLSKQANRVPINAAVFAIPSATNPAGGAGTGGQPIARGSRGGASCRPFQAR